jgi:predicted amidohydrolase
MQLTPSQLTAKLLMLITISTDRCVDDLWRVHQDVEVVDNRVAFRLRLWETNPVSIMDHWDSLGVLSPVQELALSPVASPPLISAGATLRLYLEQTTAARQQSNTQQLFLDVITAADGQESYASTGATSTHLHDMLTKVCQQCELQEHETHALRYGAANEFDFEGVKLARSGRLLASGYNKPHAIRWFINRLGQQGQRQPKSVIFIDDNSSNVFNVYAASLPSSSSSSVSSSMLPPVRAVWFPPPPLGHHERSDPMIHTIVRRAAALTHVRRCIANAPPTQTAAPTMKVLMLQWHSARPSEHAHLIETELARDAAATGRRADLVLLPEGFVAGDGISAVAPLGLLAARVGIYLVCGTVMEPTASGEMFFTTTVVFGPDGNQVALYRKRKIHNPEVQAVGKTACVFDTPFGRCAVLICLDAEDRELVDEVLALDPVIILNPTHIPCPRQTPSKHTSTSSTPAWRMALDAVAAQFEKRCMEHHCTLLRCDMPFPSGMGTSQAIG